MRMLKQEIYFPIIIGIHFIIWAVDLSFYQGDFMEISSDTLFFGELTNESWMNIHRILGEVFSSWVVTVFAFNFLMATRARWVEKLFGGLDKMYVIHRRSGVIAVFLLLAHFLVVPRDLVEFNPGKPLGFYGFILILIGVFLSASKVMKRKIPYHKWINFHKLMGIFYVLAVIHGIMVKSLIQELPMTRVYVFGMAFIGVGAWFYRAFLYRIFNKQLDYKVTAVNDLGSGIAEIQLKAKDDQLKFMAGQFAFFNFPAINKREQHPFTISSHPNDDGMRITVKGLGDYTNELSKKLNIGDIAKVEGPFGHFSSRYMKEREQIWIAGGIGITPFLSLAKDIHVNKVKLLWCVNTEEEAIYAKELQATAKDNASLEVIIWASKEHGHLTADKLGLTEFTNKAFLICGPQILKESLRKQLKAKGVKSKQMYDEEFAFR